MHNGLTSKQARSLLKEHGLNQIEQKKDSLIKKIAKDLFSPISGMLFAASTLSYLTNKIFDGSFILFLLILNIAISLWQESKADNAISELNKDLSQKVKALRDGKWIHLDSRFLVPADVVELASGEVVPADGKIFEANNVSINESSLTGESLPKDKKVGNEVFSGSFLVSGIARVEITATGTSTNFGKTLMSVDTSRKKSLLEKDIINISKFLTIISLIAVAILTAIFLLQKQSMLELLTLDLSLLIAGVPISLPTIMTLIIEVGVIILAKKKAVVRRLSALEDLANVNLLLTDKTGTLTKNKIVINDIFSYGDFSKEDVLSYSAISASLEGESSVDDAIKNEMNERSLRLPIYSKIVSTPFDSVRKRSTATIKKSGEEFTISVGAPQIIEKLCSFSRESRKKFDSDIEKLAKQGYRTLAIAIGSNRSEKKMKMAGLLSLSDELRSDAKSVVKFLEDSGISVAMVTGDNHAIADQIAKKLNLTGEVILKSELDKRKISSLNKDYFLNTSAFAEVLPEDKLNLVRRAKSLFTVASNGDGINDLPAVKAANVGIAVQNAVPALKGAADIVLLSNGISVFKDAIIESRKIFERIYTYSLYRISESFRLIITIAILGVLYRVYPLTPLQIILIALLNDIPIISLAFDRVRIAPKPSTIDAKKRFVLSTAYGVVGVVNSLSLFYLMNNVWHLDWSVIQSMFFLKLTVSGHMLIYVAHTKKLWFKFLPSKSVILATTITQLIATILVLTGFLMPGVLYPSQAAFIWAWSFGWMFVAEIVKQFQVRQ